MAYIGNQNPTGFVSRPPKEDFTGATGGTLTLSNPVSSAHDIELFINHVRQEPETSYQAAGTTVTFQGYTVAATDDIYVVYKGLAQLTSTVADGSIGTAKIGNGAVTDAKIDTMAASKLTGALPAIDGSNLTGLGGSNIKEKLVMLCDGQNYTVSSGTYTSTNVTTHQTMGTTSTDITGSSISYTPPTGTTMVIYEFVFAHNFHDTDTITHIRSFIDSDEVTSQRQSIQCYGAFNVEYHHTFLIPIGGTADTATGRQASWTSAKTLKYKAGHTTVIIKPVSTILKIGMGLVQL